jgi:hypothetical protein
VLRRPLEITPFVKKRMPAVAIILFTLDEDSVNKVLAAAICVDRVIAKPDGTTKLMQCMRDVVGLGPKESSTLARWHFPLTVPRR